MNRYRNRRRQSLEIRIWMLRKRLMVKVLAAKVGVHQAMVSQCIHGYNNNRRVLRGLLAAGCPGEFLALPDDMKAQEAA